MNSLYALWFDRTGRYILGSSSANELLVYSLEQKKRVTGLIQGAANYVPMAAFTRDGRRMLFGAPDDAACVLVELESWKEVRRYRTAANVKWVAFSQDERYFAAASHESTVQVVHARTGKVVRELPSDHLSNMNASIRVAISKDGRSLVFATRSGKVTVYSSRP